MTATTTETTTSRGIRSVTPYLAGNQWYLAAPVR